MHWMYPIKWIRNKEVLLWNPDKTVDIPVLL